MIKEIKYKGITRVPSDRDSFEGELEESINLTNVAGELRPHITPEIIGYIDGDILFVHKNSGYEHFIFKKGNDIKSVDYKNGVFSDLGTITNIYGEKIRKIESVGNTLVFITDKEIKYSLWNSGSYRYLGNKIPFPVITPRNDGNLMTFDKIGIGSAFDSITNTPSILGTDDFYESETGKLFMDRYWGYLNKSRMENIAGGYLTFPIFIRYAVRLYDGSLINHSMPFLLSGIETVHARAGFREMTLSMFGYIIQLAWSKQDLSGWKDIISSIDVFASPEIWTYPEGGRLSGVKENPNSEISYVIIKPRNYTNVGERIINTGNFYFVKKITIESLLNTTGDSIRADVFQNITANELMTDDYLSHDTITAENSFTYNNKLHLSGIQRKKFPGFRFRVRTDSDRIYFDETSGEAAINIGSQPFIFYPGKCDKVYIYVPNDRNYSYFNEIPLTPHPLLNGSYYLSPDFQYIPLSNPGPVQQDDTRFSSAVSAGIPKSIVPEFDKIYVSAHQNPFLYPVNSRITLPVGRVIGMSSNTEAISQGQFGQFPLYVFTDDGVWALEVNSEGKYMARQPVSREVCINPNILQMDKHIGFITEKGLTILSGANSECITDIIRENNIRTSKIPISSFLAATDSGSFAQIYNTDNIEIFMKGCSLAYEYINGKGRIFMINKNYPYSYVFDIETKSWGKIESDFRWIINNYPDCYVQDVNGNILNLASLPVSSQQKKCMFVTRAISQNDTLFLVSKLAHRGVFKGGIDTVIYGSRNGIDYSPVASTKNPLMAIRGTPFRYFKIAVISNMFPTDTISGCTIDLIEKFTNRLR